MKKSFESPTSHRPEKTTTGRQEQNNLLQERGKRDGDRRNQNIVKRDGDQGVAESRNHLEIGTMDELE